MSYNGIDSEEQEYRVAMMGPGSSELLVIQTREGLKLPRVCVSSTDRPAEVLQKTIHAQWGLSAYVADYLPYCPHAGSAPCVLCEVLGATNGRSLIKATVEDLANEQMSEEEIIKLQLWLEGKSQSVADVGRRGWLNEAYQWTEDAIGLKLAGKETVRQQNVGGGFVLLRLQSMDGRFYWLKATSGPNRHEYGVTKLIAQFAGDALPAIVASRDDWNAWLMADVSRDQLTGMHVSFPENAVRVLARLQAAGQYRVEDLLRAGAFDQRPAMTHEGSRELFDYLDECMALQQSQKVAPLDRHTLDRIREVYLQGCDELRHAEMPISVLHGDLTGGNVANAGENCKLLDWSETYIGFPIASLHHLRMWLEGNGADGSSIRQMDLHYREEWKRWTGSELAEECFRWAPLMAAASALYGRGDWLQKEAERERSVRRSYCRTLARHMARAAQNVSEGAVLCA